MFKPTAFFLLIVAIATTGVWMFASKPATAEDKAETIKVSCECKTKANPSWCKSEKAEWQTQKFWKTAATNPNIEWDEDFTRNYCYRHKDDGCLCDDKSLFSGTVD